MLHLLSFFTRCFARIAPPRPLRFHSSPPTRSHHCLPFLASTTSAASMPLPSSHHLPNSLSPPHLLLLLFVCSLPPVLLADASTHLHSGRCAAGQRRRGDGTRLARAGPPCAAAVRLRPAREGEGRREGGNVWWCNGWKKPPAASFSSSLFPLLPLSSPLLPLPPLLWPPTRADARPKNARPEGRGAVAAPESVWHHRCVVCACAPAARFAPIPSAHLDVPQGGEGAKEAAERRGGEEGRRRRGGERKREEWVE